MGMMPRQFKALVEMLRAELSAIKEAIHESNTAIYDAREAADVKWREVPGIIAAVINPNEEKQTTAADRKLTHSEQQQLIASQDRTARWTRNACIAAVLYGLVAAVQGYLMWRTYQEVQGQTKAAQCAARAAQSSAAAAQQANTDAADRFQKDERPYINQTVRSTKGPDWHANTVNPNRGQIVWDWSMTNYGRSPAQNIKFTQEMRIAGQPWKLSHGEKRPVSGPPLVQGQDVFDTVISDDMPKADFDRLMQTNNGISIRIKISYMDLDGKVPYETGLGLCRTNAGSITYCQGNYLK